MALLVNCKLVSPVTIEGLNVADVDLATQVLYIEPDNSLDVPLIGEYYGGTGGIAHYTVAAADFTDYTHLLPAEQREGIAAGSGAGGLGITLEDTGTPYTPENKVKITVDLDDSFSIISNHTINIDIGGEAKEDNTREAILALRTDFANQIRGGTITTFNSSTGENVDVVYTGAEGLVDVTFTPADFITDPKNNSFAITSTPSPVLEGTDGVDSLSNKGNDFTQEDDIVYVKGNFTIGEWTKIGTITVSMNAAAVAAAIEAKQIPNSGADRPEGYYGFVFRNSFDGFNSFLEAPSAISMQTPGSNLSGMSNFAMKCHKLIATGESVYVSAANSPETADDGNTGSNSVDAGLPYNYWSSGYSYITGNQENYVQRYSANKTYLATSWTRDWYFKYPSQQDIEDEGTAFASDIYQHTFWHTADDLNNAAYNHNNDLTLSGFLLAAGPQSGVVGEDIYQITGISLVNPWEESNINDAGLPSIEDFGGTGDDQDDYAYIVPQAGSPENAQGLIITGTPGATFTLEVEKVDVNDFTTGRSIGDAVFGRNVLDWDTEYLDNGAIDNGTTQVITIPSEGEVVIPWPVTPPFAGNDIFNYYLTVDAGSDTQIMLGAFDSRFGADIAHVEQAQSFSGGLNWTLGPNNKAKIRFRQIPSSYVKLSLADPWTSKVTRLYGDTNGTDVTLFASNGNEQEIGFKFVLKKETPFTFEVNDEFFDGGDVSVNDPAAHVEAWGSYGCVPDTEPDEFCSSFGINESSSLDPGSFLVTHDFPANTTESFSDLLNGDFFNSSEQNQLSNPPLSASELYNNSISPYWTVNAPEGSNWTPFFLSNGSSADGHLSLAFNSSTPLGTYSLRSNSINLQAGETYELDLDFYPFAADWSVYASETFKVQVIHASNPSNNPTTFPSLESEFGWSGSYCTVHSNENWTNSYTPNNSVVTITPTEDVQIQVQIKATKSSGTFWTSTFQFVYIKNVILRKQTQEYLNHSQQQQNEDVSIMYLRAVKGNITDVVPGGWGGDTSLLTVENASDYDEHFSVVGVLKVNSFGDYSNNYVLDLSKILRQV